MKSSFETGTVASVTSPTLRAYSHCGASVAPPNDLVGDRAGGGLPAQRRVVSEPAQHHLYAGRRGGAEGKRGERRDVGLRRAPQICRVDVLRKIAVLHAVLDAHVLMLMREVFVRFDETNGGRVPGGLKRLLIAAAHEAIGAKNLTHAQARHVDGNDFGDESRELARRRVVLRPDEVDAREIRAGGKRFAEHADRRWVR